MLNPATPTKNPTNSKQRNFGKKPAPNLLKVYLKKIQISLTLVFGSPLLGYKIDLNKPMKILLVTKIANPPKIVAMDPPNPVSLVIILHNRNPDLEVSRPHLSHPLLRIDLRIHLTQLHRDISADLANVEVVQVLDSPDGLSYRIVLDVVLGLLQVDDLDDLSEMTEYLSQKNLTS